MSASPASPPRSQQIARWFAGAAMTFAGVSHLTFARKGFRAQVPDWAKTDWLDTDDIVLVVLVAVFPGNIAQYVHQRDGLGLDTDRKRLVRLYTEPLMWAVALHAGGLLPGRAGGR